VNSERPDFETLNAYVDGELDAETAAEVARAVACDPALANQVALLSKLRSAVGASIETPEIEMPQTPKRARAAVRHAVAASLVLVLIGAGALFGLPSNAPFSDTWAASVLRHHAAWSLPNTLPQEGADFVPTGYDPVFRALHVPDLSAAKLTLVHSRIAVTETGGQIAVFGYAGTRGCKVTMLAAPSLAPLTAELDRLELPDAKAYGWRTGELDYLIVAEGMDEARLLMIAESIRRTSIERQRIDEQTRVALAESRARSAPCSTV